MTLKNAFITGGSSGIGRSLTWELFRRGYRVAITARRGELLEMIRTEAEAGGYECLVFPCDVNDESAIQDAVRKTISEWGPLDLAVANAGVGYPTFARKFDLADARALMRTNFEGTLTLFAAVIPGMIERGQGRFAAVASIAGFRGIPGASTYSASKAAMQSFLEASRVELKGTGVGVTVVNPGFIETSMTEKNSFRMPFLMKDHEAAAIIAKGLEAGKRNVTFPLPMKLIAMTLRMLPAVIYEKLAEPMAKKKRDPKKVRR